MDLIKKWLSGSRNFIIGAVLYKTFGTDEKLKTLFAGPATPYLKERLCSELSALLEKPKVLVQDTPQKIEAETMPESKDPVLQALRNEWMPLYQRMNYLRHELDQYGAATSAQHNSIRKEIALEILSLERGCMKVWDRRGRYLKEGKLDEVKEKSDALPDDPVELVKAEDSAKRNIRRNRQLSAANPGNAVYPQKVKIYEDLLLQIQAKQAKMKSNEGAKSGQ